MKLPQVLILALCLGTGSAQEETKPYHEMYNTIEPKVEAVDYVDTYDNNYPLTGYVSIPETTPAPAVLIVVSKVVFLTVLCSTEAIADDIHLSHWTFLLPRFAVTL